MNKSKLSPLARSIRESLLQEGDEDESQREFTLEDARGFVNGLDMTPVNQALSERLGIQDPDFQIQDVVRSNGLRLRASDPTNYASQCGIMSSIYKRVRVVAFNTEISDKNGEPHIWMTIHFDYDYVDGGSNGAYIMTAWYQQGRWIFR